MSLVLSVMLVHSLGKRRPEHLVNHFRELALLLIGELLMSASVQPLPASMVIR